MALKQLQERCGQIIPASHHLTPGGSQGLRKGNPIIFTGKSNPIISGKSRLMKYYNFARMLQFAAVLFGVFCRAAGRFF